MNYKYYMVTEPYDENEIQEVELVLEYRSTSRRVQAQSGYAWREWKNRGLGQWVYGYALRPNSKGGTIACKVKAVRHE